MNAPSRAPRTLVFDLDGTLSDPQVGIGRSINFALASYGYEPIADHAVSQYIGPPLDQTFRLLTGEQSDGAIARLVAKYRERYSDVGFSENSLYPGIPQALAELLQRGHRLGVCTSKRVDFAEKILELFSLHANFKFISGGDIGVSKDVQLSKLIESRTIDQGAIMIGDRAVDVKAARSNGLASVGVLWGHGTRQELIDAGAGKLLQSVGELRNLSEHAA